MHSSTNPTSRNVGEKRKLVVNGLSQLEYDGLHKGEVAWILGRRFKGNGDEMSGPGRFAHQAMGGLGNGVDRMQRLASTSWMESLFKDKLGGSVIKLHELLLDSPYGKLMDSSLDQYKNYIGGAVALSVQDVAYERAELEGGQIGAMEKVGLKRKQGIDVVATGPFLRGMSIDSSVVRFDDKKRSGNSIIKPEDMARNTGDGLAFAALEVELRRHNLMDWTPDGVILSKLESPTDEPMKSTELDARQAQLFNVGIQGPAITTAWTSDVRDYKLEVQPLDKVFVVMVADLSYTVDPTGINEFTNLNNKRNDVKTALYSYKAAVEAGSKAAQEKVALEDALIYANEAAKKFSSVSAAGTEPIYMTASKAYSDALRVYNATTTEKEKASAKATLDTTKASLDALWEQPTREELLRFDPQNMMTRKNYKIPTQAVLTNFRLQRETSSHMINYSHYHPGDNNSRLGLKLGKIIWENNKMYGVREVIVGGWCIGTVVDSAANRSTVGFQTVKTHPTSMAINLNVNVQWWSGDKLNKHFMDAGGDVIARTQKRKSVKTAWEDMEMYIEKEVPTREQLDGESPEMMIPPEPERSLKQRTSFGAAASSAFGAAPPRAPRSGSRRA